ncbi:MAG: ABC transporter substrate-binding protein, partial [Candidatus Latescibacteria bacterium]|nr:ABC transporter substrate-binding protein [Candidatus Latescibacterota bacterium]
MKKAKLLLIAALACACGGSDAPGTSLKEVPRERTMILDCLTFSVCAGQIKDYNTFNPYIPGNTAPTGWNFLYEPLYFYNAFKEEDNIIPWIATGHEYNADYTEVTVKIRPGVEWSDGRPWTVRDFVFTINMLKSNAPDLLFSTDMETWVEEAIALDDLTARIKLKAPNPRFIFTYFTHNFGNGVPIVPEHIWKDQKATT